MKTQTILSALAICSGMLMQASPSAQIPLTPKQQLQKSGADKRMAEARTLLGNRSYQAAASTCRISIDLLTEAKQSAHWAHVLLGEVYLAEGSFDQAFPEVTFEWKPGKNERQDLLATIAGAHSSNRRWRNLGLTACSSYALRNSEIIKQRTIEPDLLPGRNTVEAREATARLLYGTEPDVPINIALDNLIAADKLVPQNRVTSYLLGKTYADLKQLDKAKSYLLSASNKANGPLANSARQRLAALSI